MVRAYNQFDPRRTADTVGDVIRDRKFLTFHYRETLDSIVRAMHTEHVGAAGIVDGEGRFIGLLTEKEILRRVFGLSPREQDDALLYRANTPDTYTAWDVMIASPVCLTPDEDIEAASGIIADHGFRFMPVVDRKNGDRLLGIVSERELFHHAHQKVRRRMESKDQLLAYLMHHEPYGRGLYM